jgi:hypothetical protein
VSGNLIVRARQSSSLVRLAGKRNPAGTRSTSAAKASISTGRKAYD